MLTPWSYFRAGKNEEEGGCNDHALDFSLAGASRFRGGVVQKWRNADTGSWALKDHEIRWTEEGGLASLLE